ncbi:unnamed protein product [Cyprideis torosa]|uniref:Uncharacterized protein n=1 Tax=Cyprideis torosa TaxID=163714 RepID=A0A7R8WJF7_9CRUS|nr:unnamed protein product [Cyprideis torosa]CAG0900102.1 unnamed protein product [Cyprideis torosa]
MVVAKAYDVHLGRTETRYLRSPRRQSSCSSSVASRRGSLSPNSTLPPPGSPFRLLPASPAALPGDKPPAEVLCDFCSNSFDSQEFLNEHIKLTHRGGHVEEEEVTPKEEVEILYSTCNWREKKAREKTSAAFKQQVVFLSLLGLVPKTDGKHTEQEKLLTSPKPPAKLVLFGMNRLYRFPLSSPFGQQVFSRTNFMTMSSRISSMNREKADRHVNNREISPSLLLKPEKGHVRSRNQLANG